MSSNIQNMYRPLPQSLSDSDSEKELQMDPINTNYQKDTSSPMNTYHSHYAQKNFPLHTQIRRPKSRKTKMSTIRRILFVISILICFLTVIIFLWLLPCSADKVCPIKLSNWDAQFDNFELKGAINVIKHNLGQTLTLLFLDSINAGSEGGVVSFSDTSGEILWYKRQSQRPVEMNCDSVDLNNDGVLDCLVLDSRGVVALNAVTGETLWYLHDHKNQEKLFNEHLPIALADFDGDSIKELATAKENDLIVVNGKSGMVIYHNVIKECFEIDLIRFVPTKLTYSCNGSSNYFDIAASELRKKFFNASYELFAFKTYLPPRAALNTQIGNQSLLVSNNGSCPNCEATVILLNSVTNKQMFSKKFGGSFASIPKSFTFENTTRNFNILKGHVNGFVLKLWQYPGPHKEESFLLKLNSTVQVNYIKERTVIITFNSTNVHVINSSITDFTQLCFDNGNCQPSVSNQVDSLVITDLDGDGSKEFVGYSSSFYPVNSANVTNNWVLTSSIKVFHLENELPKLYGIPDN